MYLVITNGTTITYMRYYATHEAASATVTDVERQSSIFRCSIVPALAWKSKKAA